jgi:hypothetical protein
VSAEPEDVAGPVRSSFDEVYATESRAIIGLAALLVGSQEVADTSDGPWTFYLVTPPPGIDQVCLSYQDGAAVTCGFSRPVT